MFLLCLEGPPLQPAVGRGLLNHSIHPAPGRSTITAVHEKGLLRTPAEGLLHTPSEGLTAEGLLKPQHTSTPDEQDHSST